VGIDQSKLFFIIGIARSGTTLLLEIMNTFTDFCNNKESRIEDGTSCFWFVKRDNDFTYLEDYINKNWTKTYFVEKSLLSISLLPRIYFRYPNANYIFLERNPFNVLLSAMNLFSPEKYFKRIDRVLNFGGILDPATLTLPYEQQLAYRYLEMVGLQKIHKPLFKNQITIRYEEMIKSLEPCLNEIAIKFDIKPNYDKAMKCLSVKTPGSTNNRYDVKSLSDPKAVEMIKEACALWNYPFVENY